jgi:hypothetical protein
MAETTRPIPFRTPMMSAAASQALTIRTLTQNITRVVVPGTPAAKEVLAIGDLATEFANSIARRTAQNLVLTKSEALSVARDAIQGECLRAAVELLENWPRRTEP